MKAPSVSMLASIAVLVLGAISLFVGYFGHKSLLAANRCKMTYSNPSFIQIATNSTLSGFTLWQHTRGKDTSLLRYPVLFIHGNSGSFRQVRSFASPMHNNDTFQYFAVSSGSSRAALHGAEVIRQAVFVNEALRTIAELYGNKDIRITILAHSIGGIVARTALVLDNHPSSVSNNCLVDHIIMLGTPQKPSYAPDSTVATITNAVNKAWRNSYYYSCTSTTASDNVALSSVGMYDCNVCIRSTTTISISGGEADMHVKGSLSHLQVIEPTLINRTIAATTSSAPKHISTLIKPKGGFVRYIVTNLYRLIFATNTTSTATSASNTTSSANSRMLLENITMEHWNTHVELYSEPLHYSIRTSQLLGYPLDHLALVWCYELLSATTTALHKLKKMPPTVDDTTFPDFQNILPITPAPTSINRSVIAPLLQILSRNSSYTSYTSAATIEREYITSITTSRLITLIVVFFHTHLACILTCYVMVLLAILSTSILGPLRNTNVKSSLWQLLLPANHIVFGVGRELLRYTTLPTTSVAGILISSAIVLVALMTYDMQHAHFYSRYGPWAQWLLSYALSILLLYLLLALLSVITTVLSILPKLWRLLPARLPRFSAKLKTLCFTLVLAITIVATYIVKSKSASASATTTLLSLCFTAFYLLFVGLYFLLLLKSASSRAITVSITLLLYLPLLLLLGPMFNYSLSLPSAQEIISPLLSRFIPDLTVYVVALVLVCHHMFFALIMTPSFHPVALLCEYFPRFEIDSLGSCIHEEGGKYAIYEQYDNKDITTVNRCLVVGNTYRVITCFCHRDTSLNSTEWCEFCQCRQCGANAKMLPPTMVDINSTLVLFFALLCSIFATFFFASEYPYRIVYMLGAIAAAFCFHGLCALFQVMQ